MRKLEDTEARYQEFRERIQAQDYELNANTIEPESILTTSSTDLELRKKHLYCIFFLRIGSGLLSLNKKKFPVHAPCILCLNDADNFSLEMKQKSKDSFWPCRTRTTLSKKFRESTGYSIISYLGKLRIKIASIMIRETTLPIVEILHRVGFEDSAHFGRAFKKEMGLSPGTFRKKFSSIDY
ncbi:MAG: AraC family transcriptional regulator [Spirochaetota bacterium]